MRLYIVPRVPKDFNFRPKVKGEINNLPLWFELGFIRDLNERSEYNKKSFDGVRPFLQKIKEWVDFKMMEKADI